MGDNGYRRAQAILDSLSIAKPETLRSVAAGLKDDAATDIGGYRFIKQALCALLEAMAAGNEQTDEAIKADEP